MKYSFTFVLLAVSGMLRAQPVINNATNLAADGYTSTAYIGTLPGGPGPGGADQLWDYSLLPLVNAGVQEYVDPGTTPFGSFWPAANFGFTLQPAVGGDIYFFYKVSGGKLEQLASNITTGPGSGSDYTPNPTTILAFPFNFGNEVPDTYQKVGFSEDNLLLTYDGYGQLRMPFGDYDDVVRIRYQYDSGSDYVYWSTNPLAPIMIYNYDGNGVTAFGVETIAAALDNSPAASLRLYPNPVNNLIQVAAELPVGAVIELYDVTGRRVHASTATGSVTGVDVSAMAAGWYNCVVTAEGEQLYSGSLIIQH